MKKRILALALVLAITTSLFTICPLTVSAATEGYYTYSIERGQATILECDFSISGPVTIPDTLGGCPVTTIGESAFWECDEITAITIPSTVKTIDDYAFECCWNLSEVTIPEGVTSIGFGAFSFCESLTEITIPGTVESIGNYAFESCYSLATLTISEGVTTIGEGAFYDCRKLTNIILPEGITSIDDDTFYGCYSLTSIIIPESVTYIGNNAFEGCENLINITIPEGVTYIGDRALSFCSDLTSITIPSSVTFIGVSAFYACKNLTDICVNVENPYYSSIDGVLFTKDLSTLICYPPSKPHTAYMIPESIVYIEEHSFSFCANLTNIIIPNSVYMIGEWAFYECRSLTEIVLPNSVPYIRANTFLYCNNLSRVLYKGTEAQWNNTIIDYGNTALINATKYYNCLYVSDNSFVTYDGTVTTAYITPAETYAGKTAILALYKGDELTDAVTGVYNGIQLVFPSTAEHDTIKLMLWESLTSCKPLQQPEVISTAKWQAS